MKRSERQLLKAMIAEVLNGLNSTGKDGVAGNVRLGVNRTGNERGNVMDDADNDADVVKQDVKQAACCLIIADDGKILAVSRKDNPSDFGLPGGKVDPAEDAITAAARELKEETGLIAVNLHPIFTRKEVDGFTTTTFATEVEGQINTEESGVIRWVTPEVLCQGCFGEYNKRLFRKLGRIK